jgi:hypothetical protein
MRWRREAPRRQTPGCCFEACVEGYELLRA